MPSKAALRLTSTWAGPRSICTCGHLGDGRDSDHAPHFPGSMDGHGPCRVKGCKCKHFTWQSWSAEFSNALDALSED